MSFQCSVKDEVSLVIGADGQIGRALWTELKARGARVIGTSRRVNAATNASESAGLLYLDLVDDPNTWQLPPTVDVAYLCAAVTSQAECRAASAQSALINVERTRALTRQLIESGARVVFLSTNLVFDGSAPFCRATDPVSPRTEYGRQKVEVERRLLDLDDRVAILRLTKVLGPSNQLLSKWRSALVSKESIQAFSDMVMAPLAMPRVVEALLKLATTEQSGVFQLSADRDIPYAEAALYLADRWGADPRLVEAVSSHSSEAISQHTTLDCSDLLAALSWEPIPVHEALDTIPRNSP